MRGEDPAGRRERGLIPTVRVFPRLVIPDSIRDLMRFGGRVGHGSAPSCGRENRFRYAQTGPVGKWFSRASKRG